MTRPGRTDQGFTLLETMVSLAIVGTVMASLAVFFVRSATTQHHQADAQVAVQLAASGMDYVSQLPADNILLGRTQAAVQAEWQAPAAAGYLDATKTQPAWQDPTLPASAVQGLPTTPEAIQLTTGATPYKRWWYVGVCWQPKTGGDCTVVATALQSLYVKMYRVVVAVTWAAPDCATSLCQYASAMLTESSLDDPTWS